MSSRNTTKVNSFIQDIQFQSSEKYEILIALRKIIKNLNKKLVEDIKYGGLIYSFSGELLGGVFVYRNHISLEMGRGFELADPDNILEGKGKYRRHIKIVSIQDIKDKKVEFFIEKAFC